MNSLTLNDLIQWHEEQRNELEREEDQKEWHAFHTDAVLLLLSYLPIPFTLTEKGKEATR